MKKLPDPTADIYQILDDAGLNATKLLATRKPMLKIVAAIKDDIARQMKLLIEQRETIITKGK